MAYKLAIVTAIYFVLVLGSGCVGGEASLYQKFQAEDPSLRIEAALEAARVRDPRAVSYLVDRLEDSEPDVRFFSFQALKEITGKTMGWQYYDRPALRAVAVSKWRQWLRQGREDQVLQSNDNGGGI